MWDAALQQRRLASFRQVAPCPAPCPAPCQPASPLPCICRCPQSGMDNVRNITGSPIAGIDPHELVDTRALCHGGCCAVHAVAAPPCSSVHLHPAMKRCSALPTVLQSALRSPPCLCRLPHSACHLLVLPAELNAAITSNGAGNAALTNLPRKINIGISSSRDDYAHCHINDVGLKVGIQMYWVSRSRCIGFPGPNVLGFQVQMYWVSRSRCIGFQVWMYWVSGLDVLVFQVCRGCRGFPGARGWCCMQPRQHACASLLSAACCASLCLFPAC